MMLQRPAFRLDTIDLNIPNSKVSMIFSKRRLGKDADMVGIRSQSTIAAGAPIGRKVPSFTRLKELELELEGQKVQFGPATLSKLLSVKVPDERNPSILIEKNISISQLLQTTTGSMAGLQSSLNDLNSQVNILSIQSENLKKLVALFVVKSLDDFEELNFSEKLIIDDALKKIDISPSPIQSGFPIRFITFNFYKKNKGRVLAFLKSNIPRGLSSDRPVFGLRGASIPITSFENALRSGKRLDIVSRSLVSFAEGQQLLEDGDEEKRLVLEAEDDLGVPFGAQTLPPSPFFRRSRRRIRSRSQERIIPSAIPISSVTTRSLTPSAQFPFQNPIERPIFFSNLTPQPFSQFLPQFMRGIQRRDVTDI